MTRKDTRCVIPEKLSGVIGASRALHSPTRSKWPALYLSGGEKQICASSLTAKRSTRRQWLFRLSKGRWFNEPADYSLPLSLSFLFPFFCCHFDDPLISRFAVLYLPCCPRNRNSVRYLSLSFFSFTLDSHESFSYGSAITALVRNLIRL